MLQCEYYIGPCIRTSTVALSSAAPTASGQLSPSTAPLSSLCYYLWSSACSHKIPGGYHQVVGNAGAWSLEPVLEYLLVPTYLPSKSTHGGGTGDKSTYGYLVPSRIHWVATGAPGPHRCPCTSTHPSTPSMSPFYLSFSELADVGTYCIMYCIQVACTTSITM